MARTVVFTHSFHSQADVISSNSTMDSLQRSAAWELALALLLNREALLAPKGHASCDALEIPKNDRRCGDVFRIFLSYGISIYISIEIYTDLYSIYTIYIHQSRCFQVIEHMQRKTFEKMVHGNRSYSVI